LQLLHTNRQQPDPQILNSKPWVIPEGFTQSIVSDENALNIYPDSNDWGDMDTTNETGKHAGRATCIARMKFVRQVES